MIAEYVFAGSCLLLSIVVLIGYISFRRKVSDLLDVSVGILVDKKVDSICEKAVIIAEDSYRGSTDNKEDKGILVVEKACSIMADVLLQHGLSPRAYNLPSLVGVMRYRLGFDPIKKGGEENGKS